MNIIAETRRLLAEEKSKAKAIAALETSEVSLTEEQEAEYTSHLSKASKLSKKLDRLFEVQAIDLKKARKVKDDNDEDNDEEESKASDDDDEDEDDNDDKSEDDDKDDKKGKKSVFSQTKSVWDNAKSNLTTVIKHARPKGEAKGTRAARFIIGKGVASMMGPQGAANWARYDMGDIEVSKALNTLQQATGGALIPQDFIPDLVELLYSDTVIRAGGAPVWPMPLGNMTIPRMVAGSNAYWVGELDPAPTSQPAMSDLQLYAKKLVAMTPTSMDLVRRSPFSVETIVLNDLREQIGLKEDLAFLLSPGTDAAVPPGLLSLAATQNVTIAPALPTTTGSNQVQILQAISNVLTGMVLTLRGQNVSTAGAKWIMNYSVYSFLQSILNAFGGHDYFQNGDMTLLGFPVLLTNLLPNNMSVTRSSTTTTDNTTIFFVNFPDLIIADTMNLLTDSSNVASYESGGSTFSTYQRDQMVFRTIKEVDFNVRRPQSIVATTLTGWEPAGYTGNAGLVYVGAPVSTTPSFAGSANPVTTSPTVAANTAAVVTANTTANGAPGGTITPNSSGEAYEGA